MTEDEDELDKAIAATIAIGVLDGAHKRERLSKSIVRLLFVASEHSPRIASLLTSVTRLRDELDAERARSERMARVINVADMMRSAPRDERRDRWDNEYDAARTKVETS